MDLFHYIQLNYPPYILDLLRLIIWLILLVVIFTPLEYFWSVHQQKFFRKNFSIELGYYFLNGLQDGQEANIRQNRNLPKSFVPWETLEPENRKG